MDYIKIRDKVEKKIKKERFLHSLGVAYTSSYLASRFSLDEEKARICGIYHDMYRYDTDSNTALLLEKNGFVLEEEEKKNSILLHGPLASMYADKDFEENVDVDIKKALRHHTLGSIEMGKIGAILYIADYIEPGRRYIEDEERIYILSLDSLESMIIYIIDREKKKLKKGQKEADVTERLYKYIKSGNRL